MKLRRAPISPADPGSTVELTPFTRAVLLALLVVLSLSLGAFMDVTILVMALGLFNIAVIVFLLLNKDLTWGFLFYLTTVIFFQTGFWIRMPGFPDLYPARVASILLFLIFLIQILMSMRRVPKLGPIEKAMIVFMVIMFISIVTSGQKPRWLMLLRGYIYPFLFFYFARAVVSREDQLKLVFGYLALVGLYFGLTGIFEKLKWYELVWPKFIVDPTVRDHGLARLGFRVRGIFLQPAILGCVMTMGFFPAWHWLRQQRGMLPIVARLALLVVTPATLFFTQTRSAYLGFAVSLVLVAIWSRYMRTLAYGLILAAMTGLFLNWGNLSSTDREKGGLGEMGTIHYRIALLYETRDILMDHPFFGVGFMNFSEAALRYRKPRDVPFFGTIDRGVGGQAISHNILVTILAEQGILGFLPYILIYVFLLRRSIQAYRDLPAKGLISKDYVVCVWCALAAYLVNAMFLEMRYFEYVNVLFFFLVGAMIGMHDNLRGELAERRATAAPAAPPLRWRPGAAPAGGAR